MFKSDLIDNYRYERKFLISDHTPQEIQLIIKHHPALFSEIYHQRCINNIYFDSFDLKHYMDNIVGIHARVKARIRWYGDLWGDVNKSFLEFKIKNGELGKKKSYSMTPFSLDRGFNMKTVGNIIRHSDMPEIVRQEMRSLEPALLNRYTRKYYQSADNNYRLTVDSQMHYYPIGRHNNSFLHELHGSSHIVLELKYDYKYARDAEAISNYFPFRMTKNSKYINGVDYIYAY